MDREIRRRKIVGFSIRKIISAAILLCAAVLLAACADSDTGGDKGGNAYENRTDTPEIRALRPQAGHGDVKAQYSLGLIYDEGRGVAQNYARAARWYRMAAIQGHAPAQFKLGSMSQKGLGVPQDSIAAMGWHRKAADQGHATAQYNLGSMYHKGAAILQNFALAARWYRQAAEQGDPRAQLELGLLYARGDGVRKDLLEAYKWINLASAMAPLGETRSLSTKARNFLERRMSRPEITKSQRLSRDWMTQRRAKK